MKVASGRVRSYSLDQNRKAITAMTASGSRMQSPDTKPGPDARRPDGIESNGHVMNGTLQHQIASRFLDSLATSDHVNALQIERIRKLLMDSKRPKPDDFVKIFTDTANGDIE